MESHHEALGGRLRDDVGTRQQKLPHERPAVIVGLGIMGRQASDQGGLRAYATILLGFSERMEGL
jgi:hypothetical protein